MVASLASLAALIGSLLLAMWLLRRDADGDVGSRPLLPQPAALDAAAPSPHTLHGQLLFVEQLDSGLIALDCLLSDSTTDDEAEQPVHVVVALPDTPWLAGLAQKRLGQWLAFGDPVEVEVSNGRTTPPRVRVSCERTAFMLSLQSV